MFYRCEGKVSNLSGSPIKNFLFLTQHLEIEDLVRRSKFRLFLQSEEASNENCFESKITELLIRRSAPSLFLSNGSNARSTRMLVASLPGRPSLLVNDPPSSWMLLGSAESHLCCPSNMSSRIPTLSTAGSIHAHSERLQHPMTSNYLDPDTPPSLSSVIEWTAQWVLSVAPLRITADQRFIDSVDELTRKLVGDFGINSHINKLSRSKPLSVCNSLHKNNEYSNIPAAGQEKRIEKTRRKSVDYFRSQHQQISHCLTSLPQQLFALASPSDEAVFPYLRHFEISDISLNIDFAARRTSKKVGSNPSGQKRTNNGWMKDFLNSILAAVGGIRGLKIRLPGQTLKGIRLYPDAFFLSSISNEPLLTIGSDILLDRTVIPALRGAHLWRLFSIRFLLQLVEHLLVSGWQGALYPPALAVATALHAPPLLGIRRVQRSARRFFHDLKGFNPSRGRQCFESKSARDSPQARTRLEAVSRSFSGLVKTCSLEAL